MDGIQIVVVGAKPRLRTNAEWRETALSRRTDADRAADIERLKTDANVAMAKIDKALSNTAPVFTEWRPRL